MNNNKPSIILICLLGLSFISQASASPPKQCAIVYEDASSTSDCKSLIGPDEECEDMGTAARGETLDKTQKTLKDPDWSLGVLNFSGDCKCTLTIYSKANFKGCSLSYPFSKSKTKKIYPDKLWKKDTRSFKVVCSF